MEKDQAASTERRRGAGGRGQADQLTVRAVQRAFDLLGCFSPTSPTLTLSEFARASGLAVSTVSRLLGTLEAAGFVARIESGRYVCGGRLVQIALTALHSTSVYDLAPPYLQKLTDRTGESAYLGVPHKADEIIYTRQSLSPRTIKHAAWLGRVVPRDRTAIGAAAGGRTGPGGFVSTRDTIEPDTTAVAAPVRGADGTIVAALSVVGPTYRISDAQLRRFGRWVAEAAGELSRALGAFSSQDRRVHRYA